MLRVLIWSVGLALIALLGLRALDWRADAALWSDLAARQSDAPALFDPAMVDGLPDPARRWFLYTIGPGTPLHKIAVIEMAGEIGFGAKDDPAYAPMQARQILAPPHGFVWQVQSGLVGGTDAASLTDSYSRFRVLGLIPVARGGHDADHARSSFGRMVAEAVFWTPAALLPGPGIVWSQVDTDTARVTVGNGRFRQNVDIDIAPDGQPTEVRIMRWSNENPDRVFREQPFGGTLSDFRDFGGFRLPTRIDGGNLIGTPEYFPFFRAQVLSIAPP